ncbi:hypothetical protein [Hymenobacter metallicola]|uniref:Uncharacterized protein n=1 Tax=Hymenobacter metallicola TaxID=2563114 RepID=A0A4Z0QKJ6_9BACT|nr:hypothetical protein [Hymenobacter metallicola]TGE29779.1 hypothetical protein E5K02_10055 [Hymenobacter metallicola]
MFDSWGEPTDYNSYSCSVWENEAGHRATAYEDPQQTVVFDPPLTIDHGLHTPNINRHALALFTGVLIAKSR